MGRQNCLESLEKRLAITTGPAGVGLYTRAKDLQINWPLGSGNLGDPLLTSARDQPPDDLVNRRSELVGPLVVVAKQANTSGPVRHQLLEENQKSGRVRAVENTRITQDQDPQSYRHSAVGVHQLLNRGMRLQAIRRLQRHEIQGKFFLCQHNRRQGSVPTQGTKEVKTRPPDPKSPDGTAENLLKGPPDGTQPAGRVGNSLGVSGRTRGLSQPRIFPDTLKQPPLRLRVPA